MTIFVEEGDDVAVLHQAIGNVEDQGADGERVSRAIAQRNGIGVLILAVARVGVEVDAPDQLAVIIKLVGFGERIPPRRLPRADIDPNRSSVSFRMPSRTRL